MSVVRINVRTADLEHARTDRVDAYAVDRVFHDQVYRCTRYRLVIMTFTHTELLVHCSCIYVLHVVLQCMQ